MYKEALFAGLTIGAGVVLYQQHLEAPKAVQVEAVDPIEDSTFMYGITKAVDKGPSGCSPKNPCGVGETDCDSDADCLPGLRCWEKSDNKFPIPGISEFQNFHPKQDYCYDPNSKGNFLRLPEAHAQGVQYCTKDQPCKVAEGDCDTDDQCEGDLKCFQREVRRSIPGIYVDHLPAKFDNWDFCYDPNYWQHSNMYAAHRGVNGCTEKNPCIEGEGDCDDDKQCLGDRKCMVKLGKTKQEYGPGVPGVRGEAYLPFDYDLCYDPNIY